MSAFVLGLYAANPNAIKAPSEQDVAWWDNYRATHGDAVTTNAFNLAVANVTKTPVWSAAQQAGAGAVVGRLGGVLPLLLVGGVVLWFVLRRRKGKK